MLMKPGSRAHQTAPLPPAGLPTPHGDKAPSGVPPPSPGTAAMLEPSDNWNLMKGRASVHLITQANTVSLKFQGFTTFSRHGKGTLD